MTRTELQNKIRDILDRKDVTVRTRYAKTQIGECWGHFVALYGTFDLISSLEGHEGKILHYDNESLAYSMNDKEIVETLKAAGLNAFRIFRGVNRRAISEIVVEVSCYYSSHEESKTGNANERFFEFKEKHYIMEGEVGSSYKYAQFKLVNSF